MRKTGDQLILPYGLTNYLNNSTSGVIRPGVDKYIRLFRDTQNVNHILIYNDLHGCPGKVQETELIYNRLRGVQMDGKTGQ